jgi:AhpD family alkylhydroperoxidase
MNDHPKIEAHAKKLLANFGQALPETASAFSELQKVTFKDGALDAKTKELIALGIAIAQGCDGCMAWHNSALQRLGASREEVAEALGVAVEMGGGIALYSAAKALQGYDQFLGR